MGGGAASTGTSGEQDNERDPSQGGHGLLLALRVGLSQHDAP